ncbi:MAG: response regulator transcription factor [Blastocatellia bacterium]|nr:response regulator transcription factor [Blastocatellia bacterium]
MSGNVRIVIADDHPVFLQGLRQIIELEPGLEVVGEAGDGNSALQAINLFRPRIVILDIEMPRLDGLAVTRRLREERVPTEVILLTVHREESLLSYALELDVKGYVLKDSAVTDIVSCINAVARGEYYTSPALTTYLVDRSRNSERTRGSRPGLHDLTPTERHVLRLIADYKTSREIAEDLGISRRTVETHRTNICQKLEIHGSHALMKFALEHKSRLT